ncbi:hypothetical protein AAVH_25819 [Aphelenchoides avenae]|nr:hypothetical protein AAVH_25819 [Aphelenchus avenae]
MNQCSATSGSSASEGARQLTDAERHRALVRLSQVTVRKYRKSACSKKHGDIRKSILLKNCMKSLPESLTKLYRCLLEKRMAKLRKRSEDAESDVNDSKLEKKLKATSTYLEIVNSLSEATDVDD